ncbi:MAG: hypothetical protein D6674_03480 [Acidobacteria bacterium]|jgi:hypothetical protein|nr:MAG: hypothetical protein D6674_03480 [Acidobacteriota bacterium]
MKKEELKEESLQQEVEELRREFFKLFELILPPREVRNEVMKNIYNIELSFLRIIKTLVDYKVERLEKKVGKREGEKRGVKKVEVE